MSPFGCVMSLYESVCSGSLVVLGARAVRAFVVCRSVLLVSFHMCRSLLYVFLHDPLLCLEVGRSVFLWCVFLAST